MLLNTYLFDTNVGAYFVFEYTYSGALSELYDDGKVSSATCTGIHLGQYRFIDGVLFEFIDNPTTPGDYDVKPA